MNRIALYPLRFTPIYQYRLWGGRRLESLLKEPLPDGPVGEAWLLSDRDDHPSLVAEGLLKGKTIKELLANDAESIMGRFAGCFPRFPLLLKFLDCKEVLSVQVHPSDKQKQYIPAGENGKTEAWVVLEAGKDSLIYAGLTPGTTPENLRSAIKEHSVADHLHRFKPAIEDSVLIKAGTVHTLQGVVVFEVQENSDITFRLYDWDRTDEKTGKPRDLQVDKALACIDFGQVDIGPGKTVQENSLTGKRELLLESDYFIVWRHRAATGFKVGEPGAPRILVCTEGAGLLISNVISYPVSKGNVFLLPAELGHCMVEGNIEFLEIGLPNE